VSIPKRFVLPAIGVIAFLVLYTVYWMYSKSVIEREVTSWIDRQEAAGYLIEQDRIRVTGFPYRFQVELTAPHIHAPEGDGGWDARMDMVKAHALFYDFSHWIIEFDGPVTLQPGDGDAVVLEADLALVSLVSDRDGITTRIGAEFDALHVSAPRGTQPSLQSVDKLLLSGTVNDEDALRIRVEATGVTAMDTAFTPEVLNAFGRTAEMIRFDLTVTQWSSLASDADASAWTRAGGQFQIAESALAWGAAQISGTGDLTLDAMARPDGRISLHITDPDALADALVTARLVPAENEQALRLAAMMAPRGPDGVALPLRIRDGGVYLGPVRLGDIDS
tara:strand:- start:6870 stop:7874 length:1005 start_codon:yes stop_codon:yes gene_type:complete